MKKSFQLVSFRYKLISRRYKKSIEGRCCPDQYVGNIQKFKPNKKDFPLRMSSDKRPTFKPCLILVLESPHILEFSDKKPRPANGKTGVQIRENITKAVTRKYYNHGLIIINAIQYQCSLGETPKKFRDNVFIGVWNSAGEYDFIRRLKNIYFKGDVIINSCTKGNNLLQLREMVHKAILKSGVRCKVFKRTHPYSWYSGRFYW